MTQKHSLGSEFVTTKEISKFHWIFVEIRTVQILRPENSQKHVMHSNALLVRLKWVKGPKFATAENMLKIVHTGVQIVLRNH